MEKIWHLCLPVSVERFLGQTFRGAINHCCLLLASKHSPDMENTCCPQYTIRLDALRFDPEKNKKMRYLLNRWKRFVLDGCKPGDGEVHGQKVEGKAKGTKKARYVFEGRQEVGVP